MAGQQQQYYEEPADQAYYDQQMLEQGNTGEDLSALASVPWIAIALAVHVVLLVIAYFWSNPGPERVEMLVIQSQIEQEAIPPEPEQEPEVETEFPRDDIEVEKPTEDERIVPDAQDDNNEDPTESPNNDLAENPNDDPSKDESPHPNRDSTTSAVGLGGGVGGGGGLGGKGGRFPGRARGGGGKRPNDDRVEAALEWLKDHQNPEGYWSATNFSDDSTRVEALKTYNIEFFRIGEKDGDKGWDKTCDVGLTGLALLAFVGAGYDHKDGKYAPTCRRALNYLRQVQDNDGCFGPKEDDHFVYNHSICTMALAEAYGLSGDAILKPRADKAVEFIMQAQNPGLGWRYGVRPNVNDSSVTGWMVLALKSCLMSGLEFDTTKCYEDAAKWFELVTIDVSGYPRTGYDAPGSVNARLRQASDYDNNPSMDAIYVMSMIYMGKADLSDPRIRSLSRECIKSEYLPKWEFKKIDYYYWYYASLALFQVGGSTWDTWEKSMVKTVLDSQRGFHETDKAKNLTTKEGLDEHGSWDAVDAWGTAGGRVYSTAINCLTLEVYYRYERLHKN